MMTKRGEGRKSGDEPMSSAPKSGASSTSDQLEMGAARCQPGWKRNSNWIPSQFAVHVNRQILRLLWRVISGRVPQPGRPAAGKPEYKVAKSIAIFASILTSAAAGHLHAQGNPAETNATAGMRLDRRLGPGEFCLVKLTNGPVLKMPRSLFSEGTCATREPYPTPQVRLTFWYPDMTPTNWPGEMSMVMQKDSGKYQPQTERFRFWIVFLFAPSQIKDASYKQWDGAEPQVWQLIESSRVVPTSYPTPHYSETAIFGLREIKFGPPGPYPSAAWLAEAKKRGWNPVHNSHAYVEALGSSYDMLMHCNGGPTCEGHVQIKANHLQYRFYIPSESLPKVTAAISTANSMIIQWLNQ